MSPQQPQPVRDRRAGRSGNKIVNLVAAGGILLGSLLQASLPASAQGEVRSTHGDWQMRCDTPPGASNEQCALIQNVTASDRENVGLSVIILKTADKQARILRVLAPLGVLLPSGLGLRVDSEDIGRAGFVRCLPNGCIAEVILEDELLSKMGSGTNATFIIFQTPEEGIGIPISLNGFSEGFNALP
ncbi:invasion associated locus B family protein [Rhodobacterales bacterium]|nr:invasion associated locus B family protein [Rhodobacterales bacterium]